jgi:hypothetical protein
LNIYTAGVIEDPRDGRFWAIICTTLRYAANEWAQNALSVEVVYRHKDKSNVLARFDREYAPARVCSGCKYQAGCDVEGEPGFDSTDDGRCRNRKEPEVAHG